MRTSTFITTILLSGALAATVAPAAAEGPPSGEVAYRVVAVQSQSWIVTARNLESGQQARFKLNPRAFEGKSFEADLGGSGPGQRFTVVAPRNEPLTGCCEVTEDGGSGRPSGSGSRPPSPDSRRSPKARPAPPGGSSGGPGSGGEGGWQIVSVDHKSWIVTARQREGGQTIRFRVDPQAFVGYEFRADLHELRQGQGFVLIGLNALPLTDCCTLVE